MPATAIFRTPGINPGDMKRNDTIAAVATPPGMGGIAVIRLSGPQAKAIAGHVFRPFRTVKLRSRYFTGGSVVDPETDEILDRVLLVFFKGPKSYTGEDIIEIHCHGGEAIVRSILDLLLRQGAIAAGPGEFTRRAFLNGKMDLSQAEAIAALTAAENRQVQTLLLKALSGGLSRSVRKLRKILIELMSLIELGLDFPEEDPAFTGNDIMRLASDLDRRIREILDAGFAGESTLKGFRVILLGRVNAGKSSLFNRLVGRDRAIVTSEPGTTRDSIESCIEFEGIILSVVDTAGLRRAESLAETESIRRTHEILQTADLVLYLIDGISPEIPDTLPCFQHPVPVIAVWNKLDIAGPPPMPSARKIKARFGTGNLETISAGTGEGIRELRRRISTLAAESRTKDLHGMLWITSRQRQLLETAAELISRAFPVLAAHEYPECAIPDLRTAYQALGEIIGDHVDPDVLDTIFSRFCIGK
ncbi:tRNA uridine-5-carboxymethylaminomethyl(34) synthesis GTPase MnmE [bacterium]|nr:tRNA uridine-5-carboxymethylaminomethyl(34) synthesis GTPase MnmE [candidate division CSSED10-310 bacterium]